MRQGLGIQHGYIAGFVAWPGPKLYIRILQLGLSVRIANVPHNVWLIGKFLVFLFVSWWQWRRRKKRKWGAGADGSGV